jgi:hypothetical protein
MSDESIHRRFFALKRHFTEREIVIVKARRSPSRIRVPPCVRPRWPARRTRHAGHTFPRARLIGEPVTWLEVHRQHSDLSCSSRHRLVTGSFRSGHAAGVGRKSFGADTSTPLTAAISASMVNGFSSARDAPKRKASANGFS